MSNKFVNNAKIFLKTPKIILIIVVSIVFFVKFLPFGSLVLYPFTIFGTWVHEMSHGIAAIVLGNSFHKLMLFPDGSGVAYFSYNSSFFVGRFSQSLIAASGPFGPAIVGSLAIFCSKNEQRSRIFTLIIALIMLISLIIWVRPIISITYAIIIIIALISFVILKIKKTEIIIAYVQFLGVCCFSAMLLSVDYLFSNRGLANSSLGLSDTQVIAENLLLPHWFWAILIIFFSLILFYKSLRQIIKN